MNQREPLRLTFQHGQKRDRVLRETGMLSMRTLKNMEIIYTDGRLRMRKGYDRYNSTPLATPATQLFWFDPIDQSEAGVLLGIYDNKWYKISESGSHINLSTDTATARQPIVQFGNRVFFGTDTSWRWTDSDQLAGAPKSIDVGIEKPPSAPYMVLGNTLGHWSAAHNGAGTLKKLNASDLNKWAFKFTISGSVIDNEYEISHVRLLLKRTGDPLGEVRAEIRTDDGGDPEPAITNGISFHIPTASINTSNDWIDFLFPDKLRLTDTDSPYWLVVDTNQQYQANFDGSNYIEVIGEAINGHAVLHGKSKRYSGNDSLWHEEDFEGHFWLGGIFFDDGDPTKTQWFDYVHTFYNSTYSVESRPSDNARVESVQYQRVGRWNGYESPVDDDMVDKVRLYRREVDARDTEEDSITDTYKFVGEQDYPHASAPHLIDAILTDYLGPELQTTNHYKYSDTDDSGDKLREAALQPYLAVPWKDRIWFVEEDDNKLYFSKILEVDGATGIANTAVPDYYPLGNILPIPSPTAITALATMGNDLLVVFCADESIWTVRGANESLNPPPDIAMQEVVADHGIIAPAALGSIKGRLVYLSRDGLYDFTGSSFVPGDIISEDNQSILDAIETTYLAASVLAVFGSEIWLGVDTDNDGSIDTVMIEDLQRYAPRKGLYDRPTRMYEYDTTLNALVVRRTGATIRSLLAADAESNYILELENGTTDNGKAITGEVETHDLPVDGQIHIDEVKIDANFPNNVSPYAVTVIDNAGVEYDFAISPSNVSNPRGYRIGCRVTSLNRIRMKLLHRAVVADELLALTVSYS